MGVQYRGIPCNEDPKHAARLSAAYDSFPVVWSPRVPSALTIIKSCLRRKNLEEVNCAVQERHRYDDKHAVWTAHTSHRHRKQNALRATQHKKFINLDAHELSHKDFLQ
jgi:hypothetical protein